MAAMILSLAFIAGSLWLLEVIWREEFEMDAVVEELHYEEGHFGSGGPRWYVYVLLKNGKRVRWDVSERQFTSVFVGENIHIHCSRGRIFGDIMIEDEGSWDEKLHHPPGDG